MGGEKVRLKKQKSWNDWKKTVSTQSWGVPFARLNQAKAEERSKLGVANGKVTGMRKA